MLRSWLAPRRACLPSYLWSQVRKVGEGAPAEDAKEASEKAKDQAILTWIVKGTFAAVVLGAGAYYSNEYAKKRYWVQNKDSVKVSVTTRGKPSLGGPFTLVTTDGEPISQAEFLGRWTFFYFGFCHCPEICPIELNRMTKVVNAVREAKPNVDIQPLFVSCDPRRDSLANIKEYLSVFHPDFIGLVGTPKQVNEACKSYRIYYSLPDESITKDGSDYLIDHSIAIFFFDPKGQFVEFFGNRYTEQEITEKVLWCISQYEQDPLWTNW